MDGWMLLHRGGGRGVEACLFGADRAFRPACHAGERPEQAPPKCDRDDLKCLERFETGRFHAPPRRTVFTRRHGGEG